MMNKDTHISVTTIMYSVAKYDISEQVLSPLQIKFSDYCNKDQLTLKLFSYINQQQNRNKEQ